MSNLIKIKWISLWLTTLCVLIFIMVFIGGMTRLTDSGLSIVEWNLFSGILPPIFDSDWMILFEKYKKYPEYKLINKNIDINEFKFIFWMEYIHRFWGRLIFLAFFIPLIIFLKKNFFPKKLKKHLFIILFLIVFQGVLGWYMVKSGLIDKPDVSHYRLSIHLTVAFVIYGYLLLIRFSVNDFFNKKKIIKKKQNLYFLNLFLICLIIITVFSGGMVAGLNAGLVYNTFPLMGDKIIPSEILDLNPIFMNFLENPVTVQFDHRVLGITTFILSILIWYSSKRYNLPTNTKKKINILVFAVLFQVFLGIATLISFVALPFAQIHQLGALVIFTLSIWTLKSLPFVSKSNKRSI